MTAVSTAKSKKARARANAAPPRPPNKFFVYRAEKRLEVKAAYPQLTEGEVSKQVSAMWAEEPPEVQDEYARRADAAKVAHAARYPGYKYTPRNKEQKEAEKARMAQERAAERAEKARTRREARHRYRTQAGETSSQAGPSRSSESASPAPSPDALGPPFLPNLFGMLVSGMLGSAMISPAYGAQVPGQVGPDALGPGLQPVGPSVFPGGPFIFPQAPSANAAPFEALDPALLQIQHLTLEAAPQDQGALPQAADLPMGPPPPFGFDWAPEEGDNLPLQGL
ncbi:high mobility group box domain-containing protein [Trametes meyenii]|nr:high mobility group box domain-containing protein [Trametes meyenii]